MLIEQRRDGDHMLVWYWYLIGDVSTGNERDAKIEQMRQRLNGRRDGRVVTLATRCAQAASCNETDLTAARDALGTLRSDLMRANGL